MEPLRPLTAALLPAAPLWPGKCEPRKFSVWGAAAIAKIGRLPDTLEDRSIVVPMRRRRTGENVASLRLDRLDAEAAPLRRKLWRWAKDNIDLLRGMDPAIPSGLDDRAADNWRALLAIADAAGGTWPDHARQAAIELSRVRGEDDQTLGVQLLADLRALFVERKADKLPTEEIIAALVKLEERPWVAYSRGKSITPRGVSRLLAPFHARSANVRRSGHVVKGYALADLQDAFDRYLPPLESATPLQASPDKHLGENGSATSGVPVADGNERKPLVDKAWSAVADRQGVEIEEGEL